MRVHPHAGARQFLTAAEPLLLSDPFSTNVMAVVAGRIAAGQEPDSERHLWATVEDSDGCIVGAAMHTPPHHLFDHGCQPRPPRRWPTLSPIQVVICPASTVPS